MIKKFFNDTYHQPYFLCLDMTEKDYEKSIQKHEPEYRINLAGVHGHTTRIDAGIYIWLRTKKGLGPLVHESLHAANFTLFDRGVRADIVNDEPIAYLQQWIFEKMVKHMGRQ